MGNITRYLVNKTACGGTGSFLYTVFWVGWFFWSRAFVILFGCGVTVYPECFRGTLVRYYFIGL
jgi:hypothetical protein